MTMRLAAVVVRNFKIRVHQRQDPSLAGHPLVVVPSPPSRGQVEACSLEARARGLGRGASWAVARALVPSAIFVEPDPELYQKEAEALATQLETLSPRVQVAGDGVFLLDVRGLGRLHTSEEAFARRVRELMEEAGYPSTVGVAGTRYAATVAAASTRELRVVPAGQEAAYLGPMPLEVLPASSELLLSLQQLGLETLSELAALAPDTVEARFGSEGSRLHRLARGEDPRPLVPRCGDEPTRRSLDLDEPVERLEALSFGLKRLVDGLVDDLAERGLAAAALELKLELDGGKGTVREARPIRPTLSGRLLLELLRAALAREPLAGPAVGLALEATDTTPARAEQLILFARRRGDAEAVEGALARLRALIGSEGAVAARPRDTHRPERQVAWEPYPAPGTEPKPTPKRAPGRVPAASTEEKPDKVVAFGSVQRASIPGKRAASCQQALPLGPATPRLPARLYDPPRPASVSLAAKRPSFLNAEGVKGRVTNVRGPHRLDGEWWGDPYQRDYFEVSVGRAGRYWIYRDRAKDSWYLQGAYD